MKIVQVCHPYLGGSGRIAACLGQALARSGDTVYLVSSAEPAGLSCGHGLQVRVAEPPDHPVFTHEPVTLAAASAIVGLARDERVDVIHAHFAVPWASAAVLASQILGERAPPVIVTLHGSDVFGIGAHPAYAETTRWALERATAVTTVSRALREAARVELGVDREIDVIPNFVRPVPDAPDGEQDPPILAHASTFRPVKRPVDAVEIFARVRARRPARLRLIGDGPELAAAIERAEQLGVAADVESVGEVDDIVPSLAGVSILLAPSDRESFGLAALEAQAAGVVVVGSAVDGLPEVVAHGETGFLHQVGDLDAMAASALRVLDDPAERARMRQAARHRARERFDEGKAVARYRALYAEAIAARRLASPAA
jgi:L-malate glycosyltransferase